VMLPLARAKKLVSAPAPYSLCIDQVEQYIGHIIRFWQKCHSLICRCVRQHKRDAATEEEGESWRK
jgi:hypothetical protein